MFLQHRWKNGMIARQALWQDFRLVHSLSHGSIRRFKILFGKLQNLYIRVMVSQSTIQVDNYWINLTLNFGPLNYISVHLICTIMVGDIFQKWFWYMNHWVPHEQHCGKNFLIRTTSMLLKKRIFIYCGLLGNAYEVINKDHSSSYFMW